MANSKKVSFDLKYVVFGSMLRSARRKILIEVSACCVEKEGNKHRSNDSGTSAKTMAW